MQRFLLMIFLCVFLIQIPAFAVSTDYIPDKAFRSIKAAQGTVKVVVPLVDGTAHVSMGSGVVVDAVTIITASHVVPKEVDLALSPSKTKITFNDIPVKVDRINVLADLAVLKAEPGALKNFTPIDLADRPVLYQDIYALIDGYAPISFDDGSVLHLKFNNLPFAGRVVNIVMMYEQSFMGEFTTTGIEFLYLDKQAKGGFSGAAFVDSEGHLLAIGLGGDGGYTYVLSVRFIRDALGRSVRKNSSGGLRLNSGAN